MNKTEIEKIETSNFIEEEVKKEQAQKATNCVFGT